MKVRAFLVLALLLGLGLSINQTCASPSPNCPANALCSESFCRCQPNFILDCQTEAPFLSSVQQEMNVTNVTSYYQTESRELNFYYDYTFHICGAETTLQRYVLVFKMWVNTGSAQLDEKNYVGKVSANLTKVEQLTDCNDFVQYQVKFQAQPNGEAENLIIGLQIQPISQADQVDFATATVKILVICKQMVSSDLLFKIAIGIASFAIVVILCAIGFCVYKRWKARAAERQKLNFRQSMLENFKKETPECEAKKVHIPTMTNCSICLGDFEPECMVRKIVCGHLFHSECIDSWCLKNLSCPVCRLELDEDSIKKKRKEIEMSDYNWHENSLSAREELLEVKKSIIRK